MPYAADLKENHIPKILAYGKSGSGKTSLFRSIPGRKFLYMFDPAGLNSIDPADDIYYEEFLIDNMTLSISTLKGIRDSASPVPKAMEVYSNWENDFENRLDKNWFNDPEVIIDGVPGGFDVIGFDSLTTISDLVLDRVLQLNQRAGKTPEISDYGTLANTLARIVRRAASTQKIIFLTAHEESNQDKFLRTVGVDIMVTGKLKSKLPLLFSDIYHCSGTMDTKGQPQFNILTTPDELYGICRGSNAMRKAGLGFVQDVTIKPGKKATDQGIGPMVTKVTGLI